MRPVLKVLLLVGILLSIWSTVFAATFRYPFYWDDFHLIRHYNAAEVRSVFHGVVDLDKIETPGLRPVSILLYNLQGSLLEDNIVAHRIFMVGLMGALLSVVGTLLLEVGLQFFQIAIVMTLFVFSRVFATLVLWISLSHLILAYIFIVLTAYFFLRWTGTRRWMFFLSMLVCMTVATFTREEAYTLPVVLPLLWWMCAFNRTKWRAVLVSAVSLFLIACLHYSLWHFLVANALSPQFTLSAAKRLLTAVEASWLPGGYTMKGSVDKSIGLIWVVFLISLALIFLASARSRVRWQLLGTCAVGILLCLPALGVGRSFGLALPTIAFMTAVSIAVREVSNRVGDGSRNWGSYVVLTVVALGLLLGIAAGIRRACYVAEALQENSAVRIVRDGKFLFQLQSHLATIPASRSNLGLARLARFGIDSAEDLKRLESDLKEHPSLYQENARSGGQLFASTYDYLAY